MRAGKQRGFEHPQDRKKTWKKFFFVLASFAASVLLFIIFIKYKENFTGIPSSKEIYEDWANGSYDSVYLKSGTVLKKRPFDGEMLALHGFAAYYIFAEQTDISLSYSYLNDAITYLRQSMYFLKKKDIPKVAYVLGKAYYQKGYYYADVSLKYLNLAYEAGAEFEDLNEFRGMSASLLGDTEEAIKAFTLALGNSASDLLLFALAQNYMEISDFQNAKLYFFEAINKTKDVLLELKCRYLIGCIFIDEGETGKAKKEFYAILEKDKTSADAHYGLGVIYEIQGDLIKARSQWRKALKLNPLHEKTRSKLNLQ